MERKFRTLLLIALSVFCASCRDNRSELEKAIYPKGTPPGVTIETGPAPALPKNPSKRRLPESVKIVSDAAVNFGIDVSALTPEQASIVVSAWTNYGKILSGGRPRCSAAPFAPSDGGTEIYFCDGYDILRVHGLAGTAELPGYEYGPSVDLLNGQRVERLKSYTNLEIAKFDDAAP